MSHALPATPDAVMHWIPHRAPMLLVDAVTHMDAHSLTAQRTFRPDEYFFQGHFPPPEGPVLPGVILLEALAQTAALFTGLSKNLDATQAGYRFSKVHEVSWKAPVLPGQTVQLQVTLLREKLGFLEFDADARIGDTQVCKAHFTARLLRKEG